MKAWARGLPWFVLLAYVAAVLLWMSGESEMRHDAFPAFSVNNWSDEGLSGAFEYLKSRSRRVDVLSVAVREASLPDRATLFRVAPVENPSFWAHKTNPREGPTEALEKEEPQRADESTRLLLLPEERRWVERGGRLVLALNQTFGEAAVLAGGGGENSIPVLPLFPGVAQVKGMDRYLAGPVLQQAHVFLVAGGRPVGAWWSIGKGEVILLSMPQVFQNRYLPELDHLLFLEQLAGTDRPVLFDEYSHGLRATQGALGLLKSWGFGPFLIWSVVVVALVFWRGRSRLGAPDETYRESRNVTVDLVDALAPLYLRALKRHQALRLYHQYFVESLGRHTGLKGAALQQRARDLLGGLDLSVPPLRGKDYSLGEFQMLLKRLNEAYRRTEHAHRR